jgi:FG-GAP-like repeat
MSIAFVSLLAVAAFPADADASLSLQRIGALVNANLDIDGKDDQRVDAGIAILDTGVDLENPHLNVIEAVDCTEASAENEYACDESPGAGADDAADGHWHGTTTALAVAGIDDGSGFLGVAPGARIYGVDEVVNTADLREKVQAEYEECLKVGGKEVECAEQTVHHWDLSAQIAATKWVTAHADEIDVAVGGPGRTCTIELVPGWYSVCSDEEQVDEYHAAVKEMVDAGVVFVTVSTPARSDVSAGIGGSSPEDAIITSVVAEGDGLPGGKYESNPCPNPFNPFEFEDEDDTRWSLSGWGEGVAIAAPACAFSGAIPQVAGAAALLASADHPESREDVEAIREALIDAGDTGEIAKGGWHDNSPDGIKEPLLDVSDEELFDPVMLPGCNVAAAPEVESDVDGDGHADLVTMHPDGSVTVHGGGEGGAGLQFASGVDSRDEQGSLTPALYSGSGDYAVDVADVSGDGCADLVTLNSNGDAIVYPGRPDRSFGFPIPSLEGTLDPALLKTGGHEPIAAADVTGDGYADLVSYDDQSDHLTVYPGSAAGTFEAGETTAETVYSALHTASGEYFLDAADVTGDGKADLVSMTTWKDLYTRAGKADGTFAAAVSSQWGNVDPALDNGSGREPFGVADVTGDGKADLVLGQSGSVYVYPAQSGVDLGRFGTPKASGGTTPSTTFGTSPGFEFPGILDIDGNGNADVVLAHTAGQVYVAGGQGDGSFKTSASVSFTAGFLKSTQHFQNQNADGSELVIEKPALRRRGCAANGCLTPTPTNPASGFGAAGRNSGYSIYPAEPDGDVLQRFWTAGTGWSGWGWHDSPPRGQATSESAAVSPTSSSDYIFVTGADQALWEKHWTDAAGRWSDWSSLGGALATDPGPAAVSLQSGTMDVFARTASDKSVIRKSWTSGSGWGSWVTVSGTSATTGIGATSRSGVLNLFMRDARGDITQRWWTPSSGWSSLGSHGSPPAGAATSAPAAASLSGSVHLFARGSDQALWEKVWVDSASRWSEWTSLGGVLRSGPAATSPTSGEVHVFARFANDSYFRKRWSEAEGWSGWEPVY